MTETNGTTPAPESATTCKKWCVGHADGEDWCTSRAIDAPGTYLNLTTGTNDDRTVVAGLDELSSSHGGGLDVAEALAVAQAIIDLVREAVEID